MQHLNLIIFGLLVAVAGLGAVARVINVPYPIVLVLGGLALGFAPGLPRVELPGELVLLIFLPPLLYGAAFFTSLRDLRANLRPITLLSIGLTIVTTLAVAAIAHAAVGLSWAPAFVLGAIVSPSDAVAPATILRQLRAPRRLITIVEGENLTNDWTALVLYSFAVMAVTTGSFSLWEASGRFVLTGVGGVAIGLIVGRVIREVRQRIDDSPIEITFSLLSGYAAYLPAEALGVSGVIAAVTVGIYMGWHAPALTTPILRIQGTAVWETVQFLLNAVLFLLIGLQMPFVMDNITGHSPAELFVWALLISAVVIGVRLAWQFIVPYLIRVIDRRESQIARRLSWQQRFVIGWCGMRGAVSLAAALALPLTTHAGTAFPERNLLVFLTFMVTLVTLVGQGLTLKPLIVRLRLEDDGADAREEVSARLKTADAALARLEELTTEAWVYDDTIERVRAMFNYRRRRFAAHIEGDGVEAYETRSAAYQRVLRELLNAERQTLLALRNGGHISDEVRRRVERNLDLEESRLEN